MEFAIITDTAAKIISVSHVSSEFTHLLKHGQSLTNLLDQGSREKFTRFLQTVWHDGQASEWEMFFELNGGAHYLIFNGNRINETVCIAAAENKEDLRMLTETHCSPVDSKNIHDQVPGIQQTPASSTLRPDQKLFDDIGVLYAEMATLQRELSKKQVELEKSNQIINDYAANLEQMVAEKTRELSASEARFRGIFENSSLGIAIADLNGSIIACNNALVRIINLDREEICRFSIADFFFNADPEIFEAMMDNLRQHKTSANEIEKSFTQPSGSEKWVNINLYTLELQDEDQVNIIYIIEDITERKLNEQALLQSEKLAAVGKLAASLAHEINNPLQSIIGYLGLASESLRQDSPLTEYLHIASVELDRIKKIVSDLRDASRKPQLKEKKPADLDHVIQRVINLTRKKASEKNIKLVYQPPSKPPLVLMDSEQILQVILNLVINSIEAITENGQITLALKPARNKRMMRVIVADDGPGIEPDVIKNLFQPFFTTKQEGLGLGLHLSKAIIDAHNGSLTAENQATGGAAFSVMLPIA